MRHGLVRSRGTEECAVSRSQPRGWVESVLLLPSGTTIIGADEEEWGPSRGSEGRCESLGAWPVSR